MKRVVLGVILIAAFASLAHAQAQSASVNKAIDANIKTFIAAFNSGDAAGVAGLYAADAKLLPPNGSMIEGRQGIQTFWASAVAAGVKIQSLTPVDVVVAANIAVETGKYVTSVPATGGAAATDEGKYVVVWKRQGRDWKIARDIWNSNKPVQ